MNKRIRVCANPALTPALSPRRGRIVSRLWREPDARSVDPPSVNVRKAVRRLGLTLLGFVSLALCGCASWQRSLIYVPSQDSPARLDALAKAHGIERWKNSAGENIGWRWPARHRPARGQLLVTHGNAGYALQRSYLANPLSEAGALDVFVLVMCMFWNVRETFLLPVTIEDLEAVLGSSTEQTSSAEHGKARIPGTRGWYDSAFERVNFIVPLLVALMFLAIQIIVLKTTR